MSALGRRADLWVVAGLVLIGLLLALPGLVKAGDPNSDGLFYEVQAKQLEGESHEQAMHEVFDGPRAQEAAAIEDEPSGAYRILNPEWQEYSAQFYERRWLVPGMAIAVGEVTGENVQTALKTVSMLGYAFIAAMLFLLLRRRFPIGIAAVAALACMLLPPVYRWSFGQFVDSWGLLLETLGLLALVLVCDRGLRWLPLWIGAMLALSITRDATMVLGIAALWLALGQWRSRDLLKRNLWILVSGAAAALPALAIGGAPARENLAYIYAGYNVPSADGWGDVISGYPDQLWLTIEGNLTYPLDHGTFGLALYAVVAVAIVAIVLAALQRPNGDAFWLAMRGATLGCAVLLLVANNPQGYRLEMVFVPVIAAGFAVAITYLAGRLPDSTRLSRALTSV